MLTVVKLLVLALSITVSLARPQDDVEAVTSLETLLEDSSLEAGDIELDQGKLLRIRSQIMNQHIHLNFSKFQMAFCCLMKTQ